MSVTVQSGGVRAKRCVALPDDPSARQPLAAKVVLLSFRPIASAALIPRLAHTCRGRIFINCFFRDLSQLLIRSTLFFECLLKHGRGFVVAEDMCVSAGAAVARHFVMLDALGS